MHCMWYPPPTAMLRCPWTFIENVLFIGNYRTLFWKIRYNFFPYFSTISSTFHLQHYCSLDRLCLMADFSDLLLSRKVVTCYARDIDSRWSSYRAMESCWNISHQIRITTAAMSSGKLSFRWVIKMVRKQYFECFIHVYNNRFHESVWQLKNRPEVKVTREILMIALQNVQSIFVKASDFTDFSRAT